MLKQEKKKKNYLFLNFDFGKNPWNSDEDYRKFLDDLNEFTNQIGELHTLYLKSEVEFLFSNKIFNFNSFFIFRNLRELNFIAPSYLSLDDKLSTHGLSCLTNLKVLRLISCQLEEIGKVFTKMKNLNELSLSENQIKEIRNLHNCIYLRKLELYSNQISKIEFLQDCLLLEELNLAENNIVKVENLDSLERLTILNLSANLISGIISIQNLKFNQNVKEVYFNDENFGPNPITEEENYFGIVKSLIPNLEIFDSIIIRKDLIVENNVLDKLNRKFQEIDLEDEFGLKDLRLEKNIHSELDFMIEEFKIKKEINSNFNFSVPLNENLNSQNTDIIRNELTEKEILFKNTQKEIENAEIEIFENSLKEKKENIQKFLSTLEFLNKLLLRGNKFKILPLEHLFEFYKKYFPCNFNDEYFKASPMIVLFFGDENHYMSHNAFESFVDFSNYEGKIFKNLENVYEFLEGNFNNTEMKDKFFTPEIKKIKFSQLQDVHDLKDSEDFILALNNTDKGELKYIIFFFDVINSFIYLNEENNQNPKENKSEVEFLNNLLKNDDNVLSLLEEDAMLDEEISKTENNIKEYKKETQELLAKFLNL
jgi:hypothetical protein